MLTIIGTFFLAYGLMLPIVALHVIFNWRVMGYAGYTTLEQLKDEGPRVEAYTRTMPWQPIYNIIAFGAMSLIFFRGMSAFQLLEIGLIWLALAIVFDALTWVLLPHSWRLSWKELYVGHQPWLSLCYICIVASPFLALAF